jgi:hypothetical protein
MRKGQDLEESKEEVERLRGERGGLIKEVYTFTITVVSGGLGVIWDLKNTNQIVSSKQNRHLIGSKSSTPCRHLHGQIPQLMQ